MLNDQELLFVVDENNQLTETKPRNFVHKNGLWHRTSGIWVISPSEEVLCQKRSLKKDINPGIWEAFFGGHLEPNEEYRHNAAKEVSEELGIKIYQKDLIFYKVLESNKPNHKEFQGIFALVLNKDQNKFQFEKDEIDQLIWKNIEELKKILVDEKDPNWIKKPWDREILEWLKTLLT